MNIKVTSNISEVIDLNIRRLKSLEQADAMLRTASTSVLGMMKLRVHGQGQNAEKTDIGMYSPGYMKVRTGNYGNSSQTKAGKLKDAGVFTKGKNKGQPRPKYNRSPDPKVIASLTRQMENDEQVIPLELNKTYGIGFSNSLNFDKSQWVEETYDEKIFSMSADERQAALEIAQKFVTNALSEPNSVQP